MSNPGYTQPRLSDFGDLGTGPSAMALLDHDFDQGWLRPFREKDTKNRFTGRNMVWVNTGRFDKDGKPQKEYLYTNAPALLDRDSWLTIDREVNWAAKLRLKLWGDVYGTNPYNIPDGMGTIALQHTVAQGNAEANLSMDGLRRSERSRPVLDVGNIPLPICHSDGEFGFREIAVSRKSQIPLDTTNIKLAARAIGELIEKLTVGVIDPYTAVNGTIYGVRNFPYRNTKVMTLPTDTAWTPLTTYNEILSMIQGLQDMQFFGPYVLYLSTGWMQYLYRDYSATYPSEINLEKRLRQLLNVAKIEFLDYLPDFEVALVQMTEDVIQGINGLPLKTVQWTSGDGMSQMFKLMCINVPRIRSDFRQLTGITHGTAFAGGTSTTTTSTTTTTTTTTP